MSFKSLALGWIALLPVLFLHSVLADTLSSSAPVLMRYPSIHGNTVVFEAAGAIWRVSAKGGIAARLTADSGYDSHPLISPDGRLVAFTGWYRGNTDVFVIPSAGGAAKQLTFRSFNKPSGSGEYEDNIVIGWTPDSKEVIFLSRRESFNPQLIRAFEVPVTGGLPTPLPLPWTGPLSMNARGTAIAYDKSNRMLRSYHRKHYYGGAADDIFTYDLGSGKSTRVTHWKGTDTYPMWAGDTIYFASDRGADGVLNLWSKDLKMGTLRELTHFSTYDIDWPSAGDSGVVLSDGGELYLYSFATGQLQQLSITVPLDEGAQMPYEFSAQKMVQSASVAPDGKLAVFSARGALFTVPAKYGHTAKITHAIASNDKEPTWSPDGKWIAYVDDSGRNSQVMMRRADGEGAALALTRPGNLTYRGPILWSPDGNYLSYVTSRQQLWLIDMKTGVHTLVATASRSSPTGMFQDATFSPDSTWMAFSKRLKNGMHALFIYDIPRATLHQVSEGDFDDTTPVFSDDGRYLFFVSVRLVTAVSDAYADDAVGVLPDGLYVTTLQSRLESPLAPRMQVPVEASQKANSKPLPKRIPIDFTGLMQRAVRIPVPPANITDVLEANGIVYYAAVPISVLGDDPIPGQIPQLRAYDLNKRKDRTLVEGLSSSFMLSSDGSTLFYRQGNDFVLRPATIKIKHVRDILLDTSSMQLRINPRAEWREIYLEAWRNVRDFLVDPELVKGNWQQLGKTYFKLMPLVADRQDLSYVIGNLLGALGESHMYATGGQMGWKTPRQPTAELGAQFALDRDSGRYYLKQILRGDNTLPGYEAPLAQPGLRVKVGDYVLAINGEELRAPMNPYELLQGSLGQTVALTLATSAHGKPWIIYVNPVADSTNLYLLHWIRSNQREVDELSGGKIGYLYLDDMGSTGLQEFMREFYGQMQKPGLIIDDRWNMGGFITTILFDRLTKRLAAGWVRRSGVATPSPSDVYIGHLAALINHESSSDGDIFAYRFQQYHLGPTIGSRTWGGVRGYAAPFSLLDGGSETVSEIAYYGTNSKWVAENIGVEPSVPISVNPGLLTREHRDTQLEMAVRVLLKEIAQHPVHLPPPPPWTPGFPKQPAYPPCPVRHGTCG